MDDFEYNVTWYETPFIHGGSEYSIDPKVLVPVSEDHEDFGKTLQEIVGLTDDECATYIATALVHQVRSHRNILLAKSDWTQVPDSSLTNEDRAAWRVYRQALRDITKTCTSPSDVIWPVSPNNQE